MKDKIVLRLEYHHKEESMPFFLYFTSTFYFYTLKRSSIILRTKCILFYTNLNLFCLTIHTHLTLHYPSLTTLQLQCLFFFSSLGQGSLEPNSEEEICAQEIYCVVLLRLQESEGRKSSGKRS